MSGDEAFRAHVDPIAPGGSEATSWGKNRLIHRAYRATGQAEYASPLPEMPMSEFPPAMLHDPFTEVFDDVWNIRGTLRMYPLMTITRCMTVVREGDALTLINAVRLDEDGLAALEALGTVKNVVKIGSHGMGDPFYVDRYGATWWALPDATPPDGLTVDRTLTEDDLPLSDASLFVFEAAPRESALILARHGGILVACDSVQNLTDLTHCSFLGRVALRLGGFVRQAQIGTIWRMRVDKPRGRLKPDFERLLQHDFRHLCTGHGLPLLDVAKDRLSEVVHERYGRTARRPVR